VCCFVNRADKEVKLRGGLACGLASRPTGGRDLILICRNVRRAGRDPLRGFCQEFRIEHEYRRGTPPCRSAVQERTAVARGPASNDRGRGRTAGDARKDRALAGASVGSRRRQSENSDRALIVENLTRLRSRSCRRQATISHQQSGTTHSAQRRNAIDEDASKHLRATPARSVHSIWPRRQSKRDRTYASALRQLAVRRCPSPRAIGLIRRNAQPWDGIGAFRES